MGCRDHVRSSGRRESYTTRSSSSLSSSMTASMLSRSEMWRAPPDGHEFPFDFNDFAKKSLVAKASTTSMSSMSSATSMSSASSVRAKIALFSCLAPSNTVSSRLSTKFASTDNVGRDQIRINNGTSPSNSLSTMSLLGSNRLSRAVTQSDVRQETKKEISTTKSNDEMDKREENRLEKSRRCESRSQSLLEIGAENQKERMNEIEVRNKIDVDDKNNSKIFKKDTNNKKDNNSNNEGDKLKNNKSDNQRDLRQSTNRPPTKQLRDWRQLSQDSMVRRVRDRVESRSFNQTVSRGTLERRGSKQISRSATLDSLVSNNNNMRKNSTNNNNEGRRSIDKKERRGSVLSRDSGLPEENNDDESDKENDKNTEDNDNKDIIDNNNNVENNGNCSDNINNVGYEHSKGDDSSSLNANQNHINEINCNIDNDNKKEEDNNKNKNKNKKNVNNSMDNVSNVNNASKPKPRYMRSDSIRQLRDIFEHSSPKSSTTTTKSITKRSSKTTTKTVTKPVMLDEQPKSISTQSIQLNPLKTSRKLSMPSLSCSQKRIESESVRLRRKKESREAPSRPASMIEDNDNSSNNTFYEEGNTNLYKDISAIRSKKSCFNEHFCNRVSNKWSNSFNRATVNSFSNNHTTSILNQTMSTTMSNKMSTKMSGNSAISVQDIRRAFEKAEASLSLDALSEEHLEGSQHTLDAMDNGSVTSLMSNASFRDRYGSISSLASSTSLISAQELQGLIDEANQSVDESGTPSQEIMVVVLHRDTLGSLGITLAGGADYENKEISVHKIIEGTLAAADGRIRKGDRILSINGKATKGLKHKDALAMLKVAKGEVVLVLSRNRANTPPESCPNESKEKNQRKFYLGRDDNNNDLGDRNEKSVKSDNNGEKEDSTEQFHNIDMTQLASMSVSSAREYEALITSCHSVFSYDVAETKGELVNVQLLKEGTGLGFSLEGGKDSPTGDRPLTIKKIFSGGAADKSGCMHVGDELVSVNSVSLGAMTRIEAWNHMRKLEDGHAEIVVRRMINDDINEDNEVITSSLATHSASLVTNSEMTSRTWKRREEKRPSPTQCMSAELNNCENEHKQI